MRVAYTYLEEKKGGKKKKERRGEGALSAILMHLVISQRSSYMFNYLWNSRCFLRRLFKVDIRLLAFTVVAFQTRRTTFGELRL